MRGGFQWVSLEGLFVLAMVTVVSTMTGFSMVFNVGLKTLILIIILLH